MSSLSKPPRPLLIECDKLLHLLEYTILAILLANSIYLSTEGKFKKWELIIVVFGVLLYGISDEIHQSFVPGRFSEIKDVIADLMGGVVGAVLYFYVLRGKWRRRKT